jgi:hypothetical protein
MQPYGIAPILSPIGMAPPAPILAGPGLAPMELVVQGERKEAEYEWYRYSPIALPFLLLLLGIATVLLWLTLSQGNVTYIHIYHGIPRTLLLDEGSNEAGIPLGNRNVRIAAFIIGGVASLLILAVMYARPAAAARKGAYFGLSVLLILSGVLAWIAFALDASDMDNLISCDSREFGTLVPATTAADPQLCDNLKGIAVVAVIFDGLLGFFTIFTAICMILAVIVAGKRAGNQNPDAYYDQAFAPVRRTGLSRSTRLCLVLLNLAVILCVTVLIVFTIIISNLRPDYDLDQATGVARGTNLPSGWPVALTRMRLSTTGIIILTILITFIPFRSRVLAYVLAFTLLLTTVLCFISFSIDLKSLKSTNNLRCPAGFDCDNKRFIAVIILDILLGFLILVYLLIEFVARLAMEKTHASKVYY